MYFLFGASFSNGWIRIRIQKPYKINPNIGVASVRSVSAHSRDVITVPEQKDVKAEEELFLASQ
jgi:hypothetical protein